MKYTYEDEKKTFSNAAIKLLRKSIKDIRTDRDNTARTLLRLHRFINIVFNNPERCRKIMVPLMAGMWNMFIKEMDK